jgi:hypothetical protein
VRLIEGDNPQFVERTDHGTHRARGNLGVERGCVEPAVANQSLDHADIDAVFQQMGHEAMPQRERADPLGDLRGLRCLDDDAMQVPDADRLRRMSARAQPALSRHVAACTDLPPLGQQGQRIRREYGIAIPTTFATLDAEQLAFAVDAAGGLGRWHPLL